MSRSDRAPPTQISCSSLRLADVDAAVQTQVSDPVCSLDTLRIVLDPAVKATPSVIAALLSLASHSTNVVRMRVEDYSVQIRSQLLRLSHEGVTYSRLRELDWCTGLNFNFDSAPLLLQLLHHTPRLMKLRVSPDLDRLPLRMLAELPPTNQGPHKSTYYSFGLCSFECTGVLSGHDIALILICSANTLTHLSLVIHPPDFADLVYLLPALPCVTTLVLLPVEDFFDSDLLVEFLSHFPRVSRLSIGVYDHANPVEVAAIADAPAIHLHTLKLYSLERIWRPADARVLIADIRKLRLLRRLELVAAGFSNAAISLLSREYEYFLP
ncbi:hypothetical protein AURDEDRAFT_171192 [Auricularia subglabra TFB-10046 SS5]|uniref:F-box domain-containing protein n=1 Tax=Auricularia subglabra (strain TFB-10046 / SS5) TaxID=717982 RepID=J0LJ61_AURST|nr:hypothetical protein AURDEDRAFT_171192 [Auricularia subglabra TFB-10046 SS5]